MKFPELTPRLQQRVHELIQVAKECARKGAADLAWQYRNAAQSLRRGDEISAEYWLERADYELHALKPVA